MSHLQAEVRRMNPNGKRWIRTVPRYRVKLLRLVFLPLKVPVFNRYPGLSAMMKVSYVFSLQEKSITLRLFPISCFAGRCRLPCLFSLLYMKGRNDTGIAPQIYEKIQYEQRIWRIIFRKNKASGTMLCALSSWTIRYALGFVPVAISHGTALRRLTTSASS